MLKDGSGRAVICLHVRLALLSSQLELKDEEGKSHGHFPLLCLYCSSNPMKGKCFQVLGY